MFGNKLQVSLYRYNPEEDKFPYMKKYTIEKPERDIMVLDLLHLLKEDDQSISYRRSCREGVCGSDGMNINGKNGLACITPISSVIKRNKIELRPLPGLPVIRDLVVDMTEFYAQYEKIKPFLQNETTAPEQERLQSPEDRDKFEDTTKCILCAACTTSCPVFWTADTYVGPAAIVNAHRFVFDSRDNASKQRLEILKTLYKDCELLILDEPTNHLDIRQQLEVLELIQHLPITVVTSLHDLNMAASICDEVLLLKEGHSLAFGQPENVFCKSKISYFSHFTVCRAQEYRIHAELPMRKFILQLMLYYAVL